MLSYPKIEDHLEAGRGLAFLRMLAEDAIVALDPDPAGSGATVQVSDPNDEYLLRLAVSAAAVIVSGDRDLTILADRFPVYTPADFLALLDGKRAAPGS